MLKSIPSYEHYEIQSYMEHKYPEFPRASGYTSWLGKEHHQWMRDLNRRHLHFGEEWFNDEGNESEESILAHTLLFKELGTEFIVLFG